MELIRTHEQLVAAYEALTREGRVPTHEELIEVWEALPNEIDTQDNTRYWYKGSFPTAVFKGGLADSRVGLTNTEMMLDIQAGRQFAHTAKTKEAV